MCKPGAGIKESIKSITLAIGDAGLKTFGLVTTPMNSWTHGHGKAQGAEPSITGRSSSVLSE
jgi:hypothetical protein